MLQRRDKHQKELSRLEDELQQASAAATNDQEAFKTLKQELPACQVELATLQKDLTQWPESW